MTPDAFASAVVGVVKSTMAPLLERLAGVEAHIKILGDVRDRMIGLEVKSAIPVVLPPAPEPVDLAPLLERISDLERQLLSLGNIEAKILNVANLIPDGEKTIRDLVEIRERIAVVESKATVPGPPGVAVTGPPGPPGKDGKDADLDTLKKSVQSLVTDAIAALPPARDGKDGRDGANGVTLDDLSVEQQDERTLVVKATVGAKVKEIGSVTFPVNIYRGVYLQGKSYEPGDLITWDGSLWHANRQTTDKPVEGSKVWTLAAKRGRDAARL